MELLESDPRCLDAHCHLGNLSFDHRPELAIKHYEVGVRIGELSLGEQFNGVLPWGLIDNRPFLRCLHGYGLCAWRSGEFEEARQIFERMLWLNPSDNQGARFLLNSVKDRREWEPEED
jgi:tetratricopeptide (TPR) repeat protein